MSLVTRLLINWRWQNICLAFSLLMVAGTAARSDSAAQDQEAAVSQVQEILQVLRREWPDVSEAEVIPGNRIEYRDGTIRVGRQQLERILASQSAEIILQFVLAHEAWHSVQQQRRSRAEWTKFRRTKVLECEADFMGAAATYRAVRAKGLSEELLEEVKLDIEAFVGKQVPQVGEELYYPPNNRRRSTIGIGWAQARSSEALQSTLSTDTDQTSESERAFQACLRIASVNDGSSSLIFVTPDSPQFNYQENRAKFAIQFENISDRPIAIGTMILGVLNYRVARRFNSNNRYFVEPEGPGRISTVYHGVMDEFEIAPRSSINREYTVPGGNKPFVHRTGNFGTAYPSVTYPLLGGPDIDLLTSRYVDADKTQLPNSSAIGSRFCSERLNKASRSADRALFARLATVASVASENFKPLADKPFADGISGSRMFSMIRGLSRSKWDTVTIYPGLSFSPMVTIQAFESDNEEAVSVEYNRLRGILNNLCGSSLVRQEGAQSSGQNDAEPAILIEKFAPEASLRMSMWLWDDVKEEELQEIPDDLVSGEQRQGGQISLQISRNLDW